MSIVQPTPEAREKLQQACKAKGFDRKQLAKHASVSLDDVKRFLGSKKSTEGMQKWIVEKLAAAVDLEPSELMGESEETNQNTYPDEFRALIEEKTKRFCGRQFVFQQFEKFIRKHNRGYFTIIGEPGVGKSAIAAEYVRRHGSPCYFNVLAEGRNRPELFLRSLRQQLIQRFQLTEAANANLPTLLEKASRRLRKGERLTIVVDGLDEVSQQDAESNLLHLPANLPQGVYFLLTRRPYATGKEQLTVSPGVPKASLDLASNKYAPYNHEDVVEYIRMMLHEDPDCAQPLQTWLAERNLSESEFIEILAKKSENNFIYLRYVLPEIAAGNYDNLNLEGLPEGLQQYYQQQWVRMGMERSPTQNAVIALYAFVAIGEPLPCETLAEMTQQDEAEIEKILADWAGYLRRSPSDSTTCFSIYHTSFLEFLRGKTELKENRKIFQDVNRRIADYWKRELIDDADPIAAANPS
ncbi:AAA family ATPase [Geitlerinema sp. PCC 9228]|jgi:hypothetical protein|uniref:AAA family ATPase n=1 Tax=Geitlerinema sp. PCC 9228 TaxID=111611 RepID=UPI0008F9D335|nr:AAA family ATPase [Geitlerinema sp. PCC 9228]